MLENPDPEIVSWEFSKPQEGTEEFFGPELITTELTSGVRQEADRNWNFSELTGATAQSKVSTMAQSDWGVKALPEDPEHHACYLSPDLTTATCCQIVKGGDVSHHD